MGRCDDRRRRSRSCPSYGGIPASHVDHHRKLREGYPRSSSRPGRLAQLWASPSASWRRAGCLITAPMRTHARARQRFQQRRSTSRANRHVPDRRPIGHGDTTSDRRHGGTSDLRWRKGRGDPSDVGWHVSRLTMSACGILHIAGRRSSSRRRSYRVRRNEGAALGVVVWCHPGAAVRERGIRGELRRIAAPSR